MAGGAGNFIKLIVIIEKLFVIVLIVVIIAAIVIMVMTAAAFVLVDIVEILFQLAEIFINGINDLGDLLHVVLHTLDLTCHVGQDISDQADNLVIGVETSIRPLR